VPQLPMCDLPELTSSSAACGISRRHLRASGAADGLANRRHPALIRVPRYPMSALLRDADGQFAESLVSSLLETGGYRVLRFGVEHVLSEVKSVAHRREGILDLPPALWAMPDFLVIDVDTGATALVEVKFRMRTDAQTVRELASTLRNQQQHWPGALTVVVVAEPPGWTGARYQDHIRVVQSTDIHTPMWATTTDLAPATWWSRLAPLAAIFERVREVPAFHADADRLVPVIQAWARDA